ncbi:hypothetical protein [Streptomyces sp. NPDC002845]
MTVTGRAPLSAHCDVAQRPEYKHLHAECRRTKDIPLPHYSTVLLVRRCGCTCHPWNRKPSTP